MASANTARLGILLGLDMAQFKADMDKAVYETQKLRREAERSNDRAIKDAYAIKVATDDYGKTLTKVQQIERAIQEGRYQGADQRLIDQIRARAKAYDAEVEAVKKLNAERIKSISGLTPQQQAQIGYQMTDIFTSLVSGQNPVMVLIQQGGQLRDVFGGAGNAIRAIIQTIGVGRLAFGAFAGVLGTVAYAAYKGSEQMARLRDDLILTGNIAGKTSGYFLEFGRTLSTEFNIAIGTARDIVGSLAASGKFTATSMEQVGKVIAKYSQLAGVDGAEASKKLIPLLDGTASSARQMNSQFNFLTLAQYKQIEALEKYGRTQEAIKLQAESLLESFNKQERNLGTLEKAWAALKKTASEAWEAMLGLGREDPSSRIALIQKEVAEIDTALANSKAMGLKSVPGGFVEGLENRRAQLAEEIKFIRRAEQIKSDVKLAEAEKQQQENKKIADRVATGGLGGEVTRATELEKAIREARQAQAIKGISELADVEIDAAQKVENALAATAAKNRQEANRLVVHNAKMLAAELEKIAAEREQKIRDIESKQAMQKAQERQQRRNEEYQGVEQFLRDEENRKAEANRNNIKQFEQQKAEFELQEKMVRFRTANIFATEKEIELQRIQLETEKALSEERKKDIYGGTGGAERLAAAEDRIRAMGKMREALVELEDQQKRVAEMSDAIFGNMSRAIENFVRTGKLSFKDLARSIIADLIMIQMRTQMTSIFKSFVGNIFGGGFGTGFGYGNQDLGKFFMADGGPVAGNHPYIVGERGPELFVPSSAGTIVPNHAMGMSGVTNVTNNYIQAIDVQSFEQRLLGSSNTIWAANQYAQKSLATGRGRT